MNHFFEKWVDIFIILAVSFVITTKKWAKWAKVRNELQKRQRNLFYMIHGAYFGRVLNHGDCFQVF